MHSEMVAVRRDFPLFYKAIRGIRYFRIIRITMSVSASLLVVGPNYEYGDQRKPIAGS